MQPKPAPMFVAKMCEAWPIFPVLGCKSGLEQRDGTALRAPSTLDALSGGLDSCETEETSGVLADATRPVGWSKQTAVLLNAILGTVLSWLRLILITRFVKYG